jgi:ubiquinone/menaquinone biosynthesis C-methylase UbiE
MFDEFVKYVGKNFGNPNGIAGKIATFIMNIINQQQYNAVLQNMKLEQNNFVLDIGFGNGYFLKKLLKQNIPIKVFGIEISKDMLDITTKKCSRNIDKGNLKLSLENIEKTAFAENTFDKIYTINTIYFWNNLEKSFAEIKRILKPNCLFFNVIYTEEYLDKIIYTKYNFKKYSVKEMENITKNNGMEIKKIVEIKKNKSYCIISENK